jgi:putative lipoprotein
MKRPILGALACLILACLARPAEADDFFAPDKISHFGTSVGVGFLANTVAYHYIDGMGPVGRTLTGTAVGTATGLIVEIVDASTGHGFSAGDLGADVLGALTGSITSELFNGRFFISASNRQVTIAMRW